MKFAWTVIFIFFLTSCATINSGHYLMVRKGDTVESLAKEFKVSPRVIRNHNIGKDFRPGQWVFLPKRIGIWDPINELTQKHMSSAFGPSLYKGRLLWPVPKTGKVSSGFGPRRGRPHDGIDIPAPRGTHILAADDGKVLYSGNKLSGYGNLVLIGHSGGVVTVYAHCKKRFVKKGQKIVRGQVIAQVGSTGRSSGPHLHFEVRVKNKAVNPMPFVAKSREHLFASNVKTITNYRDQ